tara:strand:- start:627 stop:1424 length:798 start_codon:yes stop_codon:yes gene_type:complete
MRVKLLVGVLLAAFTVPAHAQSWADRAMKLSSLELSADEIGALKVDGYRDKRNKITLRRIDPEDGGVDWDTDPTAIPFMLYQINKRTDLPIYVNNDGLDLSTDDLFEHLVVYLTSHHAWSLNEKETENLGKWLKRGGTMLLDDCYNKGSPFTDSVQPEVGKMIPGAHPVILMETDKKLSDVFSMVYKTPWPGESLKYMRPWQYFMLDDRPAVFFTPNDDGCGWEVSTPPTASNPVGEGIGHGGDNRKRELFYQWISNWMMYVYSH